MSRYLIRGNGHHHKWQLKHLTVIVKLHCVSKSLRTERKFAGYDHQLQVLWQSWLRLSQVTMSILAIVQQYRLYDASATQDWHTQSMSGVVIVLTQLQLPETMIHWPRFVSHSFPTKILFLGPLLATSVFKLYSKFNVCPTHGLLPLPFVSHASLLPVHVFMHLSKSTPLLCMYAYI